MLKIGITGHRNLYDHEKVKQDIRLTIERILESNNSSTFEAWTSLAYGADTLFAEVAVNEFGATLKVVLPFNQQEFEKDFDTDQRLNEFKSWINKYADNVDVFHKNSISTSEERNNCYYETGIFICKQVDVMIAVYDNEKPEGKGGTGDIVKYCRENNLNLYQIPAYKSKLQMLRKTRDEEAMKSKKKFFTLWNICVLFSWLSAIAVSTTISFKNILPIYFFIIVLFEVILILSVFIIIKYKLSNLRNRTVIFRRETERLRVLEIFDKSKININQLIENNNVSDEVMQIEIELCNRNHKTFDISYSKKKLIELIDSQIEYHGIIRLKKIELPLHRAEIVQKIIEVVFIITVFLDLLNALIQLNYFEYLNRIHLPHELLLFASLILPPSYIAIESIKYLNEWNRLKKESEIMVSFFENTKKNVATVSTENELQIIANTIRQKMDEENSSWTILIATKDKPTGL